MGGLLLTPVEPRVEVRSFLETDRDLIVSSWLRQYRDSSWYMRRVVDREAFAAFCRQAIQSVLARAEVRIAAPPGDELTVYGYAVLEPSVVHMVYVKAAWRRMGLAKLLLSGAALKEMAWSTSTKDFTEWIRDKYPMAGYRPLWMEADMGANGSSERPKVLAMTFGEAGVHFAGFDQRASLRAPTEEEKKLAKSPISTLEMELDRQLGGVVVRYKFQNLPHTVLVPLAHVRKVELAE